MREQLLLVTVLKEPQVPVNAAVALQEVERAAASVGFADRERREALGWVDSPELVGHEVGPTAVALDLTEGHAGLETQVEPERVQDALGDGERG
jgi:hypothetical protein